MHSNQEVILRGHVCGRCIGTLNCRPMPMPLKDECCDFATCASIFDDFHTVFLEDSVLTAAIGNRRFLC